MLAGRLPAHVLLEIDLIRNGALGNEFLHLLGTVGLPVVDIRIVAHAHGTTGEDDSSDIVVVAGCANSILVSLGCASFVRQDEAGTDPDTAGAHHERGGEELAVVNTTGGDDLNGTARHGGLVALDGFDNGGNKHGGGDVTGVATTFAALGADDVNAELETLLDVLDVADHVHVQNPSLLELLDDMLGGDSDSRDEQLGVRLDDDVDQLIEFALCVIVAITREKVGAACQLLTNHEESKCERERRFEVMKGERKGGGRVGAFSRK